MNLFDAVPLPQQLGPAPQLLDQDGTMGVFCDVSRSRPLGTTFPSGPGNPTSFRDGGFFRPLGTTFPSGPGIPRYFPALRAAARGFHLGLPRKHNKDESVVPARSRKLYFRPPRLPDDETTGTAVISHIWPLD
ncbi:hypothetical protein NDU88_002626 [Pleurodeles waltl]|uniref:Uncharacterized protein n=1 Tax=Pleurodeles waltl TaxID=8319 RepID=A0AAV7T3W6_PLEWA|nr:hypothetical protein NDU88_002626 [Pleurodeles waltl]